MTCIVAYDIKKTKIRNKVAKYLLNMGVRIQKSVFAVEIERHACKRMTRALERMTEKEDSVIIIRLCVGCRKKAIQLDPATPGFYVF